MSKTGYDHLLKLVIIGDPKVGKSCLLNHYADYNSWIKGGTSTNRYDLKCKTIYIDEKTIQKTIQIFFSEVAHERAHGRVQHYRNAQAVIIVFDLTCHTSFNQVQEWLKEVQLYASEQAKVILVGNKADLKDKHSVQASQIDQLMLASRGEISAYIETSAKTGANVDQVFEDACRIVLDIPLRPIRNTQVLALLAANHQANVGNPVERHLLSLLPQIENMLPQETKTEIQPDLVDQIDVAIAKYNQRFQRCWACLYTRQSKESRAFIQSFEQNKAQWRNDPKSAKKAMLLYLEHNFGRDLYKLLKPLEDRIQKLDNIAKFDKLCTPPKKG